MCVYAAHLKYSFPCKHYTLAAKDPNQCFLRELYLTYFGFGGANPLLGGLLPGAYNTSTQDFGPGDPNSCWRGDYNLWGVQSGGLLSGHAIWGPTIWGPAVPRSMEFGSGDPKSCWRPYNIGNYNLVDYNLGAYNLGAYCLSLQSGEPTIWGLHQLDLRISDLVMQNPNR